MKFIERYLIAKENMKKAKQEEYEDRLKRLINDIEEALNKNECYILYGGTLHDLYGEFASQFGFETEWHRFGTYVYLNKRGLKKIEKKMKELGWKNE